MHSCIEIYIHIVFTTKDRKPLIPARLELRLYSYICGIAKKQRVLVLAINGMKDHIHLLVKFSSEISLGTLIREIKAYSTSWMRKQGESTFRWQEGYGAFSCSTSVLNKVKKYIANQKEHHKKLSLQEELKELALQLGIEWKFDSKP